MNKRYYFTHRFEYCYEMKKGEDISYKAGLDKIQTKRLTWMDEFENGGKLFDFFASTSGLGGIIVCLPNSGAKKQRRCVAIS